MTHYTPHPCQPALHDGRQPRYRMLLLIPLAGLAIALASCSGGESSVGHPSVTNTEPVGEGLKVIGYAMLGAAVVIVLGRLIRS